MSLKAILNNARFAQVGFVVHDIEATMQQFALLFGCEVPSADICGEYEVMQTQVFGKPAPKANCRLAFFDLTPGVQLELIEPNQEPSVWRDSLNEFGEGIHHIAFNIETGTSETVIEQLVNEFDAVVEQRGIYGDGSGQYIYLSLHKKLKCRIELLESF